MATVTPLTRTPYLQTFTAPEITALASFAEEREFAQGATITVEESPADAFFVLARGSVQLSSSVSGAVVPLAVLSEPGACFGEMALLGEGTRAVTATAVEASRLLEISRSAFDDFREAYPRAAAKFLYALAGEFGRVVRNAAPAVKSLLGS